MHIHTVFFNRFANFIVSKNINNDGKWGFVKNCHTNCQRGSKISSCSLMTSLQVVVQLNHLDQCFSTGGRRTSNDDLIGYFTKQRRDIH